jgi:hypothetical protein
VSDAGSKSEGFFARWSKRKAEAAALADPHPSPLPGGEREQVAGDRAAGSASPAAAESSLARASGRGTEGEGAAAEHTPPPPTLHDVAALDRHAPDFSRFVAPGVDDTVKRAALKKLFSDPQFNVMDGLDTYIGDYNTPDPLPASMLRQMAQAKFLGLFQDDPHEDADLQLQPDDADRRAGAGAGPEGEPGQPDPA